MVWQDEIKPGLADSFNDHSTRKPELLPFPNYRVAKTISSSALKELLPQRLIKDKHKS